MIDFNAFEKFQGEKPYRLLDQHPDGNHLAMQIQTSDVFSAAIWNSKTKQLVWSPEDAHGLAWLRQGKQIAALQNPILDEASFLFAVYSWPQGHLIHQCSLSFPMGYLFDLIISPKNDLAICQWTDQCEFGFEFIDINDHGVTHIAQNGYINRKTNVSTRPVCGQDGRLWICCYQEKIPWWTDENSLGHYDIPAKGGKSEIGGAMIFDRTPQLLGEIPLIITVPSGYLPRRIKTPGSFTQETVYISDPVFTDAKHFMVHLPSGESQVYDLSGFEAKQ